MMSEKDSPVKKNTKICLLGASFETGNVGVSALAESSIKIILNRWPHAQIILLGSGYKPNQHYLSLGGKEICLRRVPVRFSKSIFLPYHFLWFVFYGLLVKLLPGCRLKATLVNRNEYVRLLYETDLGMDITGGDSFSDIYGMRRFILGFLCKWLVLLFNKDLIMLPQTYGPFKRRVARAMAKYILKKASLVYSRDRAGVEYVKNLLNNHTDNGKIRFAPDVAFVLDARKPEHLAIEASANMRVKNSVVVGLNVSGLLFNGGYSRNNMFGLKSDYRELIYAVIEMLLKDKKVAVLLIPHVFPPPGYEVESDPDACLKIYEKFKTKYPGRIFLIKDEYDHGEIKYIIGLCDFFIGSRMHACIAALSQGTPAVGIAYSKKFYGVFESVGAEELVIDMRRHGQDEILTAVGNAFEKRQAIAERLGRTIRDVQARILNMFRDFEL